MRIIKTLSVSVLVLCISLLAGCKQKTPLLLEAVEKASESVTAGRVASAEIHVQPFFKSKVSKLCVQQPYQEQKGFERSVGHKLESYDAILDNQFVLWVFFADQSIRPQLFSLPISKHYVARSTARCSKQLTVFIELENRISAFLIKE
jgi:predicted small lipoprotein YifL